MNIKKLTWNKVESQFQFYSVSEIAKFPLQYTIWVDRETGRTKVHGLDRKHTWHNSVEEAKEWCQQNFEEIIKPLIE